jgi:hypothetical protein
LEPIAEEDGEEIILNAEQVTEKIRVSPPAPLNRLTFAAPKAAKQSKLAAVKSEAETIKVRTRTETKFPAQRETAQIRELANQKFERDIVNRQLQALTALMPKANDLRSKEPTQKTLTVKPTDRIDRIMSVPEVIRKEPGEVKQPTPQIRHNRDIKPNHLQEITKLIRVVDSKTKSGHTESIYAGTDRLRMSNIIIEDFKRNQAAKPIPEKNSRPAAKQFTINYSENRKSRYLPQQNSAQAADDVVFPQAQIPLIRLTA